MAADTLEPPWPAGASPDRPKATVTALKAGEPPSYPVTWVHDAVLRLDAVPVVKGLIERGAFAVIYGPSGGGKSFFTADVAQHIALGASWRGRRCPQALVVYVASEAGASILKRFVGWRDNRVSDGLAKIPLAVLTRGPNLLNAVELVALADQLAKIQDEAQLPLALTVFDTLSRSIPGGDENNAQDMTQAIRAADYLRDRFHTATAYVHHSGKDPDKGARGHSALFAAADVVLRVMDGTATVEKVRDGVAGERFGFTLEPIELGLDSDGEPVMTCLLNHSEEAAPAKRSDPTGKNQKIVLKELRTMSPDGSPSPGTSEIPKGVRLIKFDALADRCISKFPGMPAFKARGRISEAVSSLLASGFVGVHDEFIWLT